MAKTHAPTELVVALDFATTHQAEILMQGLKGLPVIYKVGLELFLAAGPEWVRSLCQNGVRIFLDLKFHDIPHTAGQAVLQSARLGAEFTTVHLSGGKRMLDESEIQLQEAKLSGAVVRGPKVLGVSVLTSFKEEDWIANVSHVAKLGHTRTIEDSVMHYASLASSHAGMDGMVCSPNEVAAIRQKHPDLFLMVPGIRPAGADRNDQARVMTPTEAMAAGASAIVVGRPITLASDPRLAAQNILKEIAH